jgi:hypothetical protein
MNKIKIPDVLPKFVAYLRENIAWGSLHIALDDGNIKDSDIEFCIDYARQGLDTEGSELGLILLSMSKTQRKKIGRLAERTYLEEEINQEIDRLLSI